jgi:hypothetical protein
MFIFSRSDSLLSNYLDTLCGFSIAIVLLSYGRGNANPWSCGAVAFSKPSPSNSYLNLLPSNENNFPPGSRQSLPCDPGVQPLSTIRHYSKDEMAEALAAFGLHEFPLKCNAL